MKTYFKKFISIIMLIFWMGFIFINSTSFGAVEGQPNQSIITAVKTETGIDMNKQIGKFSINAYFRKSLHFGEYGVLGLLLLNLLTKYNVKYRYVLSIVFSLLYASTDELHQSFVKGRTPLFIDLIIDTYGAAFVLILTYIFSKKLNSRNVKKS